MPYALESQFYYPESQILRGLLGIHFIQHVLVISSLSTS